MKERNGKDRESWAIAEAVVSLRKRTTGTEWLMRLDSERVGISGHRLYSCPILETRWQLYAADM
jgi:hypothetical protein